MSKNLTVNDINVDDVIKVGGELAAVTDKIDSCIYVVYADDGRQGTINGLYTTNLKKTKVPFAVAEGERLDGFEFAVYGFGKKRVVVGGCRHPGNVKQALKYWNDDYRKDEDLSWIGDHYDMSQWRKERVKLNRESRKLVTKLAALVDKKLEKIESKKKSTVKRGK